MRFNDFFSMTFQRKKNQWELVEKELGIVFPEDYKTIIDLYGEGGINEFLWLLSPFSTNRNLNSIKRFEEMKLAYDFMKAQYSNEYLFDFFQDGKGLFPWGITDNGDELFWNFSDDKVEVVIYESRYIQKETYSMTMEEFLVKILKKEIVCSFFPEDFIEDNNYYKAF